MTPEIRDDRHSLVTMVGEGTEALVRPVTPEDRDLFREGMASLSERSRQARFGTALSRLTESELSYLTEIDQTSHVAWGATIDDTAAGVGRYIMSPDQENAEVAVTVVDRYQGLGLGRVLFQGLVAIARSDGVEEFLFEVRPDNETVVRILMGVEVEMNGSDGTLLCRVPLAEIPVAETEKDFVEVMSRFRAEPSDR